MSAEPRLEVAIATRARGTERFALDVAFEVPAGISVLFGPSGAGKSTLLAAIAGILRPESGRIALGQDVWFDSARGLHTPVEQRGVAIVFQSLALFPHMDGWRNVAYGMDRKLGRKERKQRAHDWLERMKVPHLARRRPATYSGGEAQRVALARALGRSPRLMLLDEPFSALHRELREDLRTDVRAILQQLRIPTLLVTHARSEARAVGDRVISIAAGRILAQGPIESHLQPVDEDSEVAAASPRASG